jgi:hypothetical protein
VAILFISDGSKSSSTHRVLVMRRAPCR